MRARLAAEERTGRRLVHRSSSAHFDNAHCDPLTVAAEAGVPAALALAAALGALLAGLLGAARREGSGPSGDRVPAETLLPALVAILVLSLANFPIQIVPVSGPFALLAGLSLARVGGRLVPPARPAAKAGLVVVALLLARGRDAAPRRGPRARAGRVGDEGGARRRRAPNGGRSPLPRSPTPGAPSP